MLALFLVGRARMGSREGALMAAASVYKKGKSAVGVLGKALVRLIGFLADGTRTSGSNKATGNAASGGILNYRTGKLDDGTDPVGWYEKD